MSSCERPHEDPEQDYGRAGYRGPEHDDGQPIGSHGRSLVRGEHPRVRRSCRRSGTRDGRGSSPRVPTPSTGNVSAAQNDVGSVVTIRVQFVGVSTRLMDVSDLVNLLVEAEAAKVA